MAGSTIELERVSKRYRLGGSGPSLRDAVTQLALRRGNRKQDFWALRDLDLAVAEGEVLGIVGRNGAGKSTLLRIVSHITEPTTGVARTRGRVGSMLEVGTGFHQELTGAENVYLNGAILGMTRRDIRRRYDDIVSFAGVERFLDTPLKRYSSGMQVRLAFAVAAHLEPDILIVDEVLAVGDAEFQQRCLGRMAEFEREGRTIVFVSHDSGAITQLCSRVVWLNQGGVELDGGAEEVVDRYLSSTVVAGTYADLGEQTPGPLEVRAFAVVDEHGNVMKEAPRRDERLRFRVSFTTQSKLRGLDLAVWLETQRGVRVVDEARSELHSDDGALDRPGAYEITLELPPVLAAGTYVVGLWLGNFDETFFSNDVLSLELRNRPGDSAEALLRKRLVHPASTWSVRRGTNDPASCLR